VLIAIIKKELKLETSLYTLLQILSISVFERIPISEALSLGAYDEHLQDDGTQLNFLDSLTEEW
jgi:hypothetical protein